MTMPTTLNSGQKATKISLRAIVIGLSCAVLECMLAPYNDYVIRNTFLAGGHFPLGPFFVLSVLVLVTNSVLVHLKPKIAFSSQDLVVIWCIMIAAAGIPSSGMMRNALSTFVAYDYFATPENEWRSLFFQYIPTWRVVRDKTAIVAFFEGATAGATVPWQVWLKPLSIWSLYVLIAYYVMICLCAILRKQWVDYDRCQFPLVQLPVEISTYRTGLSSSFFQNKMLWLGVAIPAFIHVLNGLHTFFPTLPEIPVRFRLDSALVDRPFSAIKPLEMIVFWSMIGFSYLLSLEVAFSLWFFYLFFKLQCLIGSLLGLPLISGPGVKWTAYSFSAAQEGGACLTFVAFVVFQARGYLKKMFVDAVSNNSSNLDQDEEAMPYQLAIFGLLGGILILAYLNHLMGMTFAFALMFVFLLLGMFVALTWQIINGGIPVINPSFSPQSFFLTTLGTSRLTPSTISWLFMHPTSLTSHLREFMMPNVMNGLKAADEVKINRRHLVLAMGLAMVLGLIVSYYSVLTVCYQHGALHLPTGGSGYLRWLNAVLTSSKTNTDWINTGFTVFGSMVTLSLIFLRRVFVWWPIHPIGYTMLSSWASHKLWFSILLGYLVKYNLLKYGGLNAYRQTRPFFMGLILGEMTCAALWSAIGMITGINSGYRILPN